MKENITTSTAERYFLLFVSGIQALQPLEHNGYPTSPIQPQLPVVAGCTAIGQGDKKVS